MVNRKLRSVEKLEAVLAPIFIALIDSLFGFAAYPAAACLALVGEASSHGPKVT